jgi:diguanylate cyclase (GGDEF)-like protein
MNAQDTQRLDFPDIVSNISTLGVVVVDSRFTVLLWNRFMELNSNVRAEEVLGRNLFDTFPELNRNWLEKKIRSCVILKTTSFSSWRQRPYIFRFNASPALASAAEFMYQDASIFPVHDRHGVVQGTCISIHDVTELADATRLLDATMEQTLDLVESNQRDALTGLYNRKFFDEQITQEMVSARRYNWPMTLALLDIDHFKLINDRYGHPGGDRVLRSLAACLQGMLRTSDSLCRYGGEEFALILPQVNSQTGKAMAERLRSALAALQIELDDGAHCSVTISIGLVTMESGYSPGQMIACADQALYASKNAGRNRVTVYQADS